MTGFHWITPSLAVGARVTPERIPGLARDHRITAVVDLREEDRDDEAALAAAGIAFLHLPTPDRTPPSAADLDRGVAFARERIEAGERVLVHCEHGVGRSAVLALCVMCDAGDAPLDALRRAKEARPEVSPGESQYQGWCAWLRARGIEPPDFHAFGCVAYRRAPGQEGA